jgi:hypothetical protein
MGTSSIYNCTEIKSRSYECIAMSTQHVHQVNLRLIMINIEYFSDDIDHNLVN